MPAHYREIRRLAETRRRGITRTWHTVLVWYKPVVFDAKVIWNSTYISHMIDKKHIGKLLTSLMVFENLPDSLKGILRKSYQSQKIKFKELLASHFISASFNPLYYSLTLILSQKLYHAICFNGCALASCSARPSRF